LKTKEQLKIEYRDVALLVPYVRNTRTHSDEQISEVATSINEFGFTNPILVDGSNGIIAGHGRLMAAQKLGMSEVPVIELSHLNEAQKRAYVIADNKLAEKAGWDEELLALELGDLAEMGYDNTLTGFSENDIANIIQAANSSQGLTDEDEVKGLESEPITVKGDVWKLGSHRLMCGDSTCKEQILTLLDGEKIDLVHTDPPYGIGVKGDRSDRGGLLENSKLPDFIDDSTEYAEKAFKICEELKIIRQVWWGANYYAHVVPQSASWFVWDKRVEEKHKDTQSDCELAWVRSKWSSVRIFRHIWKGMIKGSENGIKRIHPTQKPIALIDWVIEYYKNIGSILDLFGGSGSTLIAAEKNACKAYLMELETYYCDVIINRWQNFTGQKATLVGDGRTFEEIAKERGVDLSE